ncbi:DUF3488 and transglutaminase-like domain-containing protein [Jatrophihabitans sp. YIM 134969]
MSVLDRDDRATSTLPRPGATPSSPAPAGPAGPGRAPSGSAAAAFGARSAAGRTFRTWLGLVLGLTPLFMIISDARWYVVGIGATVVTVGPAWALRLWRPDLPARVWQLLPGLIVLPLYLTAVCVPTGAYAGIVPSKVTWTQLSLLHDELVDTIANSSAPIHSTAGVRLALAALLGAGVIMVDVLCTVLEAPAMVGLVLLPVFVLSGGTVREPVALWWFALAAIGYLLILSTTGPEARPWGRTIGRRPAGAPPSLVSGRTIGLIAIVVAVLVPLVTGGTGANVVSDALHTNGGDGDGTGSGTGGVTQLASLKGALTRGDPVDLMTVTVPANAPVEPYYLRQSVLDVFTGAGWVPAGARNASVGVDPQGLAQDPQRPAVSTYDFRAYINVSGLDGRAVTFGDTVGARGLPDGSRWDPTHGTFSDAEVSDGVRYDVAVQQPDPTPAQIAAATDAVPRDLPATYLGLPRQVADLVTTTTERVVGAQTNPYLKAKALSDFFTDGSNGFQYSLEVPAGDSDDDLVNFLTNKQGFCQQYAATMAVMLRVANVPSRVVVGYTHVSADDEGTFTVTTRDAHAWVEAYIGGLGWLAFDPTPLAGADAARSINLPYLQPTGGTGTSGPTASSGPTATGSATSTGPGRDTGIDPGAGGADALTLQAPDHTGRWVALWVLIALVVMLLLTPAALRLGRSRRARRVTGPEAPEARVDDLQATCLDLGLPWSPARSPRAIGAWLAELGVPDAVDRPLLAALEQARYGRTPPEVDPRVLDDSLTRTAGALRRRAGGLDRVRARLWPRSVTLDLRRRARARVDAVRSAFSSWSNRPGASTRTYGGLRRR